MIFLPSNLLEIVKYPNFGNIPTLPQRALAHVFTAAS